MKNKLKNSIAIGVTGAVLAGSTIGGVAISDMRVQELERYALYEQVKSELSVKYLKDIPFSIEEFRVFSEILNEEARRGTFKRMTLEKDEPPTKLMVKQMYEK